MIIVLEMASKRVDGFMANFNQLHMTLMGPVVLDIAQHFSERRSANEKQRTYTHVHSQSNDGTS